MTEAGSGGKDTVQSSVNIATLAANVEVLTLSNSATLGGGNAENNDITANTTSSSLTGGSAGLDTLHGQGGNDTLDGGSGNDSLAGGTGNDTYIIDAGDTISDTGGTDEAQIGTSYHACGRPRESDANRHRRYQWHG